MSPSWIEFLFPRKGDTPCLGIVLGREALWIAQTRVAKGVPRIEFCERVPLKASLFSGNISSDVVSQLKEALAPFLGKSKGTYLSLQVALPDPAVRLHCFELDKLPSEGAARKEFLNWKFKEEKNESPQALRLTSQVLGEEDGKILLLGMAVEEDWIQMLQKVFEELGVQVAVIDMALGHRFDFFYETFREKGTSGALVTLEPEYWSLAIWDKATRLRFVRSKWWDKEIKKPKDIPLQEFVMEVERTIRSYVYSGKDRSVENLFVSAPEAWEDACLEALHAKADGNCVGLTFKDRLGENKAVSMGAVAPTALATAVER